MQGPPGGNLTAAAKKLIVSSGRNTLPVTAPRGGSASGSGAVIDLTEDSASGSGGGKVWLSGPNNSAGGNLRIANVVGKADSISKAGIQKPGHMNQRISSQSHPVTVAQTSNHVTSSNTMTKSRPKVAPSVTPSTAVTLVSSEEEEELDGGMVDDRSDKTWTSNVSRVGGTRRKSARLAAKTTPTSATEGSESSQGVEDGEDSRSRSPLGRANSDRRNKSSKAESSIDDSSRLTLPTDEVMDVGENSNPTVDVNTKEESDGDNSLDAKKEEPSNDSDNCSNDVSSVDKTKPEYKKEEEENNHENGDVVVSNGINNENSNIENSDVNVVLDSDRNIEKSCDNLFTLDTSVGDMESNFIDELCDSLDNPFPQDDISAKTNAESKSELDVSAISDQLLPGNDKDMPDLSSVCTDSDPMFDPAIVASALLPGVGVGAAGDDEITNEDQNRGPKKCIKVSMWGPSADGDDLVIGSPGGENDDSVIGGHTGKRPACEFDSNEDNAKRQKLDQ